MGRRSRGNQPASSGSPKASGDKATSIISRRRAVAIGPYHRGKSELLIKDKDKWWCVKYFLSEHSLNLEKWLCDMSSREEEARSYYSEDVSMDSHSFLEMLLLDSCFIFHAFRLIICPLLYPGWPSDQIKLDLLMLENQIPFFVLVQLYCGLGGEQEFRKFAGAYAGTIIHYAVNSFTRCNMGSTWDDSILPEQVLQLLHLFRLSLGPSGNKSTLPPQRRIHFMGSSPRYVPSVTEASGSICY
ncbi:UPF0481 protein At3g47200-like [Phoenix dactylifera]|uniref:UPF0481 protein At3g47200-like n=1 Tax=Phoenix dactylifera TaxID=42345 RepID=A0A8B7CGR6_PHODC|nr:UPF0481 protein At3g47200-like [Phoenix dactylifera]